MKRAMKQSLSHKTMTIDGEFHVTNKKQIYNHMK